MTLSSDTEVGKIHEFPDYLSLANVSVHSHSSSSLSFIASADLRLVVKMANVASDGRLFHLSLINSNSGIKVLFIIGVCV